MRRRLGRWGWLVSWSVGLCWRGGAFAQPPFNHIAVKPPMLADLLPGYFALLNQFVERRFGYLQVGGQFVDRENFVELGWHGVAVGVRVDLLLWGG